MNVFINFLTTTFAADSTSQPRIKSTVTCLIGLLYELSVGTDSGNAICYLEVGYLSLCIKLASDRARFGNGIGSSTT